MSSSLILATGSSFKVELMSRLDLDFETDPADLDESPRAGESPAEMASRLARAKARCVHDRHPDAWVLGADQTVAADDTLCRKPGTVDAAVDQLRHLAGRTHHLHCAVALASPDDTIYDQRVDYEMTMRDLDDEAIRQYVHRDRPLRCAGAYKIEQGGIRLFRSMRGDDYTAIIGLPLTRVWNILERTGYFATRHPDG
jgi:septum formation protein